MGTFITVLVLVVCFDLVIRYMWRKHKRGETSCGCGCSSCAHGASSHSACSCHEQQTHSH